MAEPTPFLRLLLCALAAGAVAAQLGGPLAADWRASKGTLKRRLQAIPAVPPGRRRRLIGAAVLSATLAAGALTAYAAQPGAPERLAAQAAGVVGSGDQLALRLVENSKERTIRPGDDYADGWKLDALTATSATLTKDGERREVGLNPTGALASKAPAAPPSQVQVAQTDEQRLERVLKTGLWDGKTPKPGLSVQETARYFVLLTKNTDGMIAYQRDMTERFTRAGLPVPRFASGSQAFVQVNPADAPEYAALLNKWRVGSDALARAAYDRYGPVEVHVDSLVGTPGNDPVAAAEQQYPDAHWNVVPDPTGAPGGKVVLIKPPAESLLYSATDVGENGVRMFTVPPGANPSDRKAWVDVAPPPP